MASPAAIRAQTRAVLVRLALTSNVRARAYVPAVSGATPGSRPPIGESRPVVEELAIELERAGDDVVVLRRVLQRARDELDAIVRRPLADLRPETADDLREQVLERGEGFPVTDVATAMRCTPTFVRRARIAAGRDPEHGRPVTVNGNGSRLDHALDLVIVGGLSVRAAAAATGVPRSTLGNHARRAG